MMRYRLGLAAAFGSASAARRWSAWRRLRAGCGRPIADQRVLETIGRRGRRAFDEHEIGLDEAFERGSQGGLTQPADLASNEKEKSRPRTAPIGATSRATRSRSSRAASDCWRVAGIAGMSLSSARSRTAAYLLDEQGNSVGPFAYSINRNSGSAWWPRSRGRCAGPARGRGGQAR